MGVTTAQINTFASTYSPYATMAGASLGVSGATILAQWAEESAYGTSNLATGSGNLAGLTTPGSNGTSFQSFANPAAFEQAYVNTIATNFPGAENTGSDLSAFVRGLTNSQGQSYSTDPNYLTTVAGALGTLENTAGVTPNIPPTVATSLGGGTPGATTTGGAAPGTTTAGATGGCGVTTGLFTWSCWQGIITDLAFIAIGVLIFIVAVASGLFGGSAQRAVRRAVS